MILEMPEIDYKGKSAHIHARDFLHLPATGAPYWSSIVRGTRVTFFEMKAS